MAEVEGVIISSHFPVLKAVFFQNLENFFWSRSCRRVDSVIRRAEVYSSKVRIFLEITKDVAESEEPGKSRVLWEPLPGFDGRVGTDL
jgi:hypothetical protein